MHHRDMACSMYIIVNTFHKGDKSMNKYNNNNNNNNNNLSTFLSEKKRRSVHYHFLAFILTLSSKFGDGASLSMRTWSGGGAFTGDFDGKAQKFGRWASLVSGARWGTCVVID